MSFSNFFIASVPAFLGAGALMIFLDYFASVKVRFIVIWLLLIAFAIIGVEILNGSNQDNTLEPVVRVP